MIIQTPATWLAGWVHLTSTRDGLATPIIRDLLLVTAQTLTARPDDQKADGLVSQVKRQVDATRQAARV